MVESERDLAGPVLVGVDFSAPAEAALLWAARAADRFGVRLLIVHVVHDPGAAPGYYAREDRESQARSLEDIAREMMTEFLERAAGEHPELGDPHDLDTLLVVGLPATRLIEVAEKTGAQLVVMGSSGRTGLAHILLGSKAERVAQLSPVPVTIVKEAGNSRG